LAAVIDGKTTTGSGIDDCGDEDEVLDVPVVFLFDNDDNEEEVVDNELDVGLVKIESLVELCIGSLQSSRSPPAPLTRVVGGWLLDDQDANLACSDADKLDRRVSRSCTCSCCASRCISWIIPSLLSVGQTLS
jgi:hypothetical protein